MSEYMTKTFEDHVVVPLIVTEHVQVFQMRRPGTRVSLVQLAFTPEGICIMGDLSVRHNGVCSRPKGFDWFLQKHHKDYLAEKFLEEGWHRDLAVRELREQAEHPEDYGYSEVLSESLRAVAGRLESGRIDNEYELYDDLSRIGYDTSDGLPGWGYDPVEVDRLHAIQTAFRRLCLEGGVREF